MNKSIQPLTERQINRYLSIIDLTRPKQEHAIRLLYEKMKQSIHESHPDSEIIVHRGKPIVSIEDNYENLLIPADNISRSSTYTHYVNETSVLRTHASAVIPEALRTLAARTDSWNDVVILVPGLVYRRDVADKKHVGQIHMLDVWRVVRTTERPTITNDTLRDTVKTIAQTAAPGWKLRIETSPHPYTNDGVEVNAVHPSDGRDIEILECGLIKDEVLRKSGLDPAVYSGWALGMGLDRLVMTLKDIPDVRYLRSNNPKIAAQMKHLRPYKEVSKQPRICRDMSYSVPLEYVEEDISQDIMEAMDTNINALEEVEIVSQTQYAELSENVRKKLGILPRQKNVLVRITLCHLERSLTKAEANLLYDQIYKRVNYGTAGYSS